MRWIGIKALHDSYRNADYSGRTNSGSGLT